MRGWAGALEEAPDRDPKAKPVALRALSNTARFRWISATGRRLPASPRAQRFEGGSPGQALRLVTVRGGASLRPNAHSEDFTIGLAPWLDLPGSEPLLLRSSGTSECLPSPSAHGRMLTPANSTTRRETADRAGLPPAHAVSLWGTSSGRSLPSSDDPSLADRKQGGEAAILEPDPPHARRSKRQHRGPLLTRAPVACGPTTRRRSRLPKNLAALGLAPRILASKSPRHRRSHGLRA